MKAAVFKGPSRSWVVETLPDPTPGTGEMVLKVGRCGICGTDVHMTSGHGRTYPAGTVPGHEYAGEVVAIGADVSAFHVRDLVTAMPFIGCGTCAACLAGNQLICERGPRIYGGGFAEYVLVAASSAVKLPQSLSLADGALVEPLAVGLHGARLAGATAGKKALVLGVGPIGLAVIHALRADGAGVIGAAARSERRRELALAMGADAYVLTGEGDKHRVAAALGGAPDLVFECVGSPGALNACIRFVRSNGTVVSLGMCAESDPVSVVEAAFKQVRLLFSAGYTLPEFSSMADRLDAGQVDTDALISETVALNAVGDVIDGLRSGARVGIKIQVNPSLS